MNNSGISPIIVLFSNRQIVKLKIIFTGSESTAKTTISEQLAEQLGFAHVAEFARSYINKLQGKPYTYEDVIAIAEKQREIEEMVAKNEQITLFDTDMLTLKIWLQYYGWPLPNWMNDFIEKHQADLYLLMQPDIAWHPDSQRQNPHDREKLFAIYENELQQLNANYRIISGVGETRIENCRRAIEDFLSQK